MFFGPQADGLQADCNYTRGFALLDTVCLQLLGCPIPSMPIGVPIQLLNAVGALHAVEQGEPGLLHNVSEQLP